MSKSHFTVWEEWSKPGRWGYTFWQRGRCCFQSAHRYVSKRAAAQAIARLDLPLATVPVYDTDGQPLA